MFITCAVTTLAGLVLAQGRQGQGRQGRGPGGGSPWQFLTDVPDHPLDVVQARPTMTSTTLSLMAARNMNVTLRYDPGGTPVTITLKAGVPFEVELTGLKPDSTYRYTIAAQEPLASGTFHTARPAGVPFVFDIQADSHLDTNVDPRVYVNTLANVIADKADFLVDLGDTFMTEKYRNYQDAARQYVAQRYYFGLVGAAMPAFLALGNHDGESGMTPGGRGGQTAPRGDMTVWSRGMRQQYFPQPVSNGFYSAGPPSADYFAWAWGDAQLIVLDPFAYTDRKPQSEDDGWVWTLGRTQYEWLRSTLDASKAKYTFVFIHHLVGGGTREARGGAEASVYFEWGGLNKNGSKGFATHRPGWPMPIHDLLVAHHVTAVFHGHDHTYVHQVRDDIDYQEVPQPGSSREGNTTMATEAGYASGTKLGSPGHLRVTVAQSGATVEYVQSRVSGRNAEVADRYVLKPAAAPAHSSVAQEHQR